MELAAVVVVPTKNDFAVIHEARPQPVERPGISRTLYSSLQPIVGNDVLQTWTERVHKLGVYSVWLTSSPHPDNYAGSALGELARQGVERLLLIRLKSYAEMDLADLIRFHCQSHNSATEVHDSRGQLGVSVLDHHALPHDGDIREPVAGFRNPTPYAFHGYAKRILSARERQELVGDALTGACAMQPLGAEIRNQVWGGKGVHIAESAKVIGPSYIGDGVSIRAGATVGPFASVERESVVDCGTTVEHATVLPCTYLAPGLLIRHALVDGGYIEDLSTGTVADLQPGGLSRRLHPSEHRTLSSTDCPNPAQPLGATPSTWFKVRL